MQWTISAAARVRLYPQPHTAAVHPFKQFILAVPLLPTASRLPLPFLDISALSFPCREPAAMAPALRLDPGTACHTAPFLASPLRVDSPPSQPYGPSIQMSLNFTLLSLAWRDLHAAPEFQLPARLGCTIASDPTSLLHCTCLPLSLNTWHITLQI